MSIENKIFDILGYIELKVIQKRINDSKQSNSLRFTSIADDFANYLLKIIITFH